MKKMSVKMRLGYNSSDEIFALIPILNQYPLANITIHPRTGKQQYGGHVDLDTFARAASQLRHKIIYNGDICSQEDYTRIIRRFPDIEDVMIGRGILYNPLLPLKIKGKSISRESDLAAARLFITTLLAAINARSIPEASKMRKTKEYWCLLRRSLPITEQQSLAVLHAQSPEETRKEIFRLLDEVEKKEQERVSGQSEAPL